LTEFWSDAVGDTLNKSIMSLYVTEDPDDDGAATSANFDFDFELLLLFDFFAIFSILITCMLII
jgi:hypothetical protein